MTFKPYINEFPKQNKNHSNKYYVVVSTILYKNYLQMPSFLQIFRKFTALLFIFFITVICREYVARVLTV